MSGVLSAEFASEQLAKNKSLFVAAIVMGSRKKQVTVGPEVLKMFDRRLYPDQATATSALNSLEMIGVAESRKLRSINSYTAYNGGPEKIGWSMTEVGREALRLAYARINGTKTRTS